MTIGGLGLAAPALYIHAGNEWFSVADPKVRDVYLNGSPVPSGMTTGNSVALLFRHPAPVRARITLAESGVWTVSAEKHTRLGLRDGQGVHHVLSLLSEVSEEGAAWIIEGANRVVYGTQALLTEGLNQLFMSSPEIFLHHETIQVIVAPLKSAKPLLHCDIVHFASAYEASEARGVLPAAPSEPTSPEEARLRNELDEASRQFADISAALESSPPGEIWNLLSNAAQMARRRRDLLQGEMASLKQHVGDMHAAVEEALDMLQNKPPLLTADQYAWALAYARNRVKG